MGRRIERNRGEEAEDWAKYSLFMAVWVLGRRPGRPDNATLS